MPLPGKAGGPRGIAGFLGAVARTCTLLIVVPACTLAALAAVGYEPVEPGNIGAVKAAVAAPPYILVALLLLVGVLEETAFRILPLGLALWLTRRFRTGPRTRTRILVAVAVVSAAAFGLAHGNAQALMFQGVAGLIFARAFLLYAHLRAWWYGALVVIAAHAAFDTAMVSALKVLTSLLGERVPFT